MYVAKSVLYQLCMYVDVCTLLLLAPTLCMYVAKGMHILASGFRKIHNCTCFLDSCCLPASVFKLHMCMYIYQNMTCAYKEMCRLNQGGHKWLHGSIE